jgi:hypothetical protein
MTTPRRSRDERESCTCLHVLTAEDAENAAHKELLGALCALGGEP